MSAKFAEMLTGGHPNSLGRTLEVVEQVMSDKSKLPDLLNSYHSQDEVVRLRTSNALKRISRAQPTWLIPHIDLLLNEVAKINQPSVQWTIAQVMLELSSHLQPSQQQKAIQIFKHNLQHHHDWIVINMTMQTLAEWAHSNSDLASWLKPHLQRLSTDKHKSIQKRAERLLAKLQ